MTRSRSVMLLAGGLLLAAAAVWLLRWQLGSGAMRIVEPAVRRWVAAEVARLSDSSYALSLSPIRVTAGERRVAFDSLRVVTTAAVNARRARPLPEFDLRLHGCAIEGLDLDRLAAGAGLHAVTAGCDSAIARIVVPHNVARDTGSTTAFLSLRDTLRLPSNIPSVALDLIRFPDVRLDLTIRHQAGDSTALRLGRLEVAFDSVAWDPAVPRERRPTLLSRDVVIRLTRAEGSRGDDHMTVTGLRASLADSTLRLEALAWTPVPGARADSLGVAGATADSIALAGVDWEAALTAGDVVVRQVDVAGLRLTMAARDAATPSATETRPAPWSLERFLRALHRTVVVDHAVARDVEITHRSGRATTSAREVAVASLHVAPDDALPAADLVVTGTGLRHAWDDHRATVESLVINLPAGTVDARALRYGTTGTDGEFAARRRWRSDRIGAAAAQLAIRGLDGAAWIRTGDYRARALRVAGLELDVFSDKRLPPPPVAPRHRTPQAWLRTAPVTARLDSIVVRGGLTYRERNGETGMIGELRFEEVHARISRFATGSGSATRPIGFLATARFMGLTPFQVQARLPRTPGFEMNLTGRLGAMPVTGLNPMLVAVSDFTFAEGQIDWIDFTVETHDGRSTGVVRPRYRDLKVSMPGVGRSGILGGVRRAIAGMVANSFVVRGDNHDEDPPALDGTIAHDWTPSETLVQHLWVSIREGLKQVLAP